MICIRGMAGMDQADHPIYEGFIENIRLYHDLYEKGLKKEANRHIGKFASEFQTTLPKEIRDGLLYRFCRDVCDGKDLIKLRRRGNWRLPYPLDQLVWEYLKEQCRLEAMPQLRWTYELYGHNPFDAAFDSFEMLKRAFSQKGCDEKTAELYFDHHLHVLSYGAHEFPNGCCIARPTYEEMIRECRHVLAIKSIKRDQINMLMYYEKLYKCFYAHYDSGREKDFYALCENEGINFENMPAYFYKQ